MVRPRKPTNETDDELPRGDGNYAMVRALNRMTEFLQQNFCPQQGDQNRVLQAGCTYERFLAHRTPTFTGEEDPLLTGMWIEDLERTFEVCGCTEAHKVLYGSYLLHGEAANWWKTKRELLEMELGSFAAVSWQRFKKEFDDCFFPIFMRRLVEVASIAERERGVVVGSPLGKKRLNVDGEGSSSGSPQKFVQRTRARSQAASGVRIGGRAPVCGRCNRAHEGECRQGWNQCFQCGQMGHFACECPNWTQGNQGGHHSARTNQRQLVQAWVYALTPGSAGDEVPETQDAGIMAA
ncbi:hypothetical protein F2P56_035562 [Juglans regia]|uniref:Uncharacterized protein LOC108997178 n=2 Tax=Juglans regia TaxID=51240 RepID=A0A2I4FB59_JUGRE|nr:uncharacterized protein LOC108997178 [Juglans regia]KAF5442957.1 hypothetical protein F2P56_035562 [Juglans regia]